MGNRAETLITGILLFVLGVSHLLLHVKRRVSGFAQLLLRAINRRGPFQSDGWLLVLGIGFIAIALVVLGMYLTGQ